VSTLDVTHGVYIEGTNVNLMAVPGVVNLARARFDEPGELRVICNEYCGAAHHYMAGKLIIRGEGEAVAGTTRTPPIATAEPQAQATPGEALFETKGCAACHSIDGSESLGPTMKGIFGRRSEFADGTELQADAAYIESAIRFPNATIVKGYQPIMPEVPLTDDEVRQLVDYVKALS